ncbi:unnamed protein product [Camellia sinensis]
MDIDRIRRARDDRKSDCRSFGSNSQKCSQSRKISIGVMVDSFVKTRPKNTKEDEGSMPIAEKVSSKVNSMGDGRNGEGVKAAIKGKQTEAPENETSPWVSTRSFHQKNTTSETIHYAKLTTNLLSGDGMSNKLNGVKAAPTTYSVQFFANQMSALQSDDGKQKNFDEVSCRTEGGKEGTRKGVEEFSFAVQDSFVPEKEVVENKANKTEDMRETLRMKLWDILGTVSSPNKQVSQDPEMGVNNLSPEQNIDKKCKSVVKPRQNSDTIETDSESPDHAIRRPVTRSSTRNRAPSKVQTNKLRNLTSSTHTKKYPENIYSFEDGFSGRLDTAVTGGSPKFYRKKRERKGFKTEAHKICFPAKDNADEIQQATDMNKTTRCAEKTSSLGNRKGSFQRLSHENNIEFVERENGIQKKDSHQLSETMKMTVQPRNVNHVTIFPQHRGQQEDLANSSLENIVDPHSDLQSPTFEIRTPTKSISPCSPPKTNHGELDDHSHAHCSFNSLLASKPDYYRTDVGTESSDDAEELEGSPFMKSDPIVEEEDAKNRLSESSSKERDSKSSKEGSPIHKGRGTESLSPEIGNAWNSKFALHPSKRIRSEENIKFNGFSPISNSPKETEESKGLQGPLGQNQEDGLANAITLFALALERVKSKIKLVTSKKSAEVLMPVAEGIHSQLQNAESQIQRDVGKLTSLSKSKRKRLETEFEEQQEQLKFIYQKFKAEVNRHLEECKSTVEGLDTQERELRGVVEKQKTSQRKLLKQLEEAVETQLSDAQRRITAVHNSAREKMLQLKYVVAECLKEGILS